MAISLRTVGLGVASFIATLAPRTTFAQIESPAFELEWNAPAQCPTRESFLAELKRALGFADSQRMAGEVRVDIGEDGDKSWTATVRTVTQGVSGERVLHAETCQTVASAAAVIAAVALEVPPREPSAHEASAPSSLNDPRTGETRESRDSQLAIGAAAILDQGTMPSLDFGVEGSMAWALRLVSLRLRLGISGAVFENQALAAQARPSEGGIFSLMIAAGRACGTRLFGSLEIGPCLGGEANFMNGSGTGTTARDGKGAWAALDASALASWSPVRRLGVNVRIDGVLPLARPSFVIERPVASALFVYRPAPVAFRAAIGIELRFF